MKYKSVSFPILFNERLRHKTSLLLQWEMKSKGLYTGNSKE